MCIADCGCIYCFDFLMIKTEWNGETLRLMKIASLSIVVVADAKPCGLVVHFYEIVLSMLTKISG